MTLFIHQPSSPRSPRASSGPGVSIAYGTVKRQDKAIKSISLKMNLYMTIYTVYNRDINTARHTDTCRKVHLRKEVSAARAQAQPGARSASCRCGWGLALLRCAADVHTAHGAAQRRSGLLVWFLRILSRSAGRTGRTQPQLGRSRACAGTLCVSVCLPAAASSEEAADDALLLEGLGELRMQVQLILVAHCERERQQSADRVRPA